MVFYIIVKKYQLNINSFYIHNSHKIHIETLPFAMRIFILIFFLYSSLASAQMLKAIKRALSADEQREKFLMTKVDQLDQESMSFVKKYFTSNFGLYAYKANYLLPLSYSSKDYIYWDKDGINGNYEKQYETEFQISLKKPVLFNLLGLHETLTFAYTQRVWWQVYSDSSPFRETNYEPEFFVTFPTPKMFDKSYGLKGLRVGFVHESNGQDGLQSRSWNRLYFASIWQHQNIFTKFRIWYRIPEDKKKKPTDSHGDDNPNIEKYMGYGDITLSHVLGKSHFTLLLRNNLRLRENKGAVRLSYSYPLAFSKDTFLYIKLFSGYGESLIDYDRYINKASIGFSFSRGLF